MLDLITVRFMLGYMTRPLHLFGGIGMLSTGLGILILIAISAVELKALFKAQLVIQDYNNGVMQAIYREIVR